ncbi:hypothetical protein [Thalassotalea fusca]
MNQSILFNDDLAYDNNQKLWRFSGLVSGQNITIEIISNILPANISTSDKFDWELAIEDWLTEQEEVPSTIRLTL